MTLGNCSTREMIISESRDPVRLPGPIPEGFWLATPFGVVGTEPKDHEPVLATSESGD